LATKGRFPYVSRYDDGKRVIVICEPQCREISHEKVNSGFIYGLRLAFPEEAIKFYADISHIQAIKEILIHDKVAVEDIEYMPIKFRSSFSIVGMAAHYFLFSRIFSETLASKTDRVFFLSFSPTILYVIKRLKQRRKYVNMKFAFVLHGDFENISSETYQPEPPTTPPASNIDKIRQTKLGDLPRRISRFLGRRLDSRIVKPWQSAIAGLFPTKGMIEWKPSDDVRYIALSPHIAPNAGEFIDVKRLNMHTVVLPTVFAEPFPMPNNAYPKFATFGYGNSTMLWRILLELESKGTKKPYEIRGMDTGGTDGFPIVTCPSPGKRLTRAEMEEQAQDIDMFLILYEENRYRLSCSGSILESLSYMKPVLHFNNDCVNTFNKPDSPIGFRCNTTEELASMMVDIIENYQKYTYEFQTFRENILKLRKECSIENSVVQIKNSFSW
jgi:hypothetical protein